MPLEEYKLWSERWIAECFRVLKPTGSFYLMTIDKHLEWKLPIMAKHGVFINLIKWKNTSAVHDKRKFLSSCQAIMLYGKTSEYKFKTYAQERPLSEIIIPWNKKRAAKSKGQMLDYWDDIPYIYAGSIKHKEAILEPGTNKKAHLCQMPEMLAGRCILFSTDEGDLVIDPFSGSGTTAATCDKLKRNFKGSEKVKKYFDQSIERLQKQNHNLFGNG